MVRTEIHVDYDFDPTDPREVVARSENVFVGRVQGLVSRKPRESSIPGFSQPETQFLVRVFEVLVSGGERPVEGGALVTEPGRRPEPCERRDLRRGGRSHRLR